MCFSIDWIVQLLVWLVLIGAIFALISLALRFVLPKLPEPMREIGAVVVQAFTIIMWAVVVIFVIYFIADLISCLWSAGGGLRLPHRP